MSSTYFDHLRFHTLKLNFKILEKILHLHSTGKLTTDELQIKLSNLKQRFIKAFSDLSSIDQALQNSNSVSSNDLIAEHLYITKSMHAEQFCLSNDVNYDSSFIKNVQRIEAKIQQYDFTEALDFCSENRVIFKNHLFMLDNKEYSGLSVEQYLKIFQFKKLCRQRDIKEAVVFFRQNAASIDRKYLTMLIEERIGDEIVDDINDTSQLGQLYAEAVYTFHGISAITRLSRRLAYGIVAYKTFKCGNNYNCPTCSQILKDVKDKLPFAKRDVSIIICSDCGRVTDHDNLPYLYDSSYVYCRKCTEDLDKSAYCKVTGMVCMGNPKICYFV